MEKNLLDGQFLVRFVKRYLFLAVLFLSSNFWSQILWSSTNGSAYRTAGNWTGGAVPTSSQIAQFAVNPTPATFIGININSAQQVGAIEVTNARSLSLQIGNSGNSNSSGLLQFNGAAVNSVSNVIIRNNSSQLLTFQDLVSGATGSKLGLVLSNATSNIINIDGAGGVTISSIISGTGKLEKSGSGSGILILSGANTYSGGTTITSGTLQLGAVNALPVGNPGNGLVLNGGTLKTGATSGFSSGTSSTNNIGTLNLSSNSTITLGTGNHSLYFAASNAVSWSGSALTITGWTGSAGATGTAGKIFVGSNASGLTGAQLAKITFSGYTAGAALLSTGELVPTSTVSPTVTTATVTGITNAAASGGGDVTTDGGAAITARGVAFGTAANPTTGTTETGTTGVFTSSISGLAVNTRYYYRAYATNSAGTSYGTENNFYTLANAPSAPGVGSPTETSLTVSIGSGDGNPSITEYAIQTGSQFVQADGTLGATAIWQTSSVWGSKIVTGLSSSTNYIFHVKARNGSLVETSYGATGDSTTLVNQNIDWGNIQFPTTVSIMEGATVDVYTQAFKNGLTESAGQAPGLSAWIGYSSSNSNPNGTGWTWIPSTFNSQSGNNDEFKTTFGAGLIPGSYYYASRFQIGSGSYSYGGTGGLWNNDNGVLTVGSNVVDFANIQSPFTATIVQGGNFNVYTKVYKTGYTETAGANANLSGWIGYSATNAATISDFANASWTWIPATFNVQVLNDDEYVANIGMSLPAGVFYYVSRYKVNGSTEYKYGGINNNFWNTAANSGVLTVQTPKEINIKQGSANIATNGTYTFASQAAGTSSSAITFTVENTGQESLSVGALSISGANANEFSITQVSGSLPQSITGGGTTTFTVTFSPTIAGSKVAQLSLVNDDANENPYVINLSAVAGPSNDNCSFPASITVNATAAAGTLVASSPQSGFSENDVWYTFTPSCTGQLALTLNGFTGADLGFSVFANSCPASNTGAIVNQDSGSTGGAETNTFSYTGGTTYYVRVWKFGGADTTFNFRITSPALGTPTNITANPTTFCEGATVIFTATVVTNATSYVWTVPSGWTINSTSSNTMTATVGSAAGAVTAKAINCYGEGIQKSQSFTPGVIPAMPGNITGNVTVCQGASNTYSVTAVSGATSYTWIMPSGWTGTSTTNSITLAAGGLSGTISVTANNTCGSSAAQTLSVTVTPAPVAIAGADITATTFTANWVSVGATGYELDVSTSPTFGTYGSTSVSESFFNANFNTGYYTSATDVVLGKGTWNMYQVLKTTSNYNTSSTEPAGVQMRAGQGIIITPAIDYISSITFIARRTGTTANKINVYKIVNGTETLLQQLDDNSSFTTYNVPVNETNTAVRIKIASASNTIYLDDVTINSNISIPSFVTGYNALPVSGNSQIVSGLSPNTTYYYRVRAVSGSCHTSNSNIITVTTNNTVIWTNNIWTNNTGPTSILDAIVREASMRKILRWKIQVK